MLTKHRGLSKTVGYFRKGPEDTEMHEIERGECLQLQINLRRRSKISFSLANSHPRGVPRPFLDSA